MGRSPIAWTRAAYSARMIDVIISCEHGGNRVPHPYRDLFAGADRLLASHRGYDPGALPLARRLARAVRAPLHAAHVTRLLVDLNRSLHHPEVFSARVRALRAGERARIVGRHYLPHRQRIEHAIAGALVRGATVLHVGVHTFTPVRLGVRRRADVGLLYDPGRGRERRIAHEWRELLREADPELIVRRNYPYRGTADGLTTYLRARFSAEGYVGLELEVNQRLVRGGRRDRVSTVVETFRRLILEGFVEC